jgi:hypothetical protein
LQILKPRLQPPDGVDVEFVLVRFQIAKLGELFLAVIESAGERLRSGMHDLVCPDIAVLGESFAADVAVIGPFAGVSTLVGLEVAELAEALAAGGFFTHEGFDAGVGAAVDLEVGFLVEGFAAAGDVAEVAFLGGGGWGGLCW